eukprot:746845-Rhodomonas_salina.2
MLSVASDVIASEVSHSGQSSAPAFVAVRLSTCFISEEELKFSGEHICGSSAFAVLKAMRNGNQVAVKVQHSTAAKGEFEEELLNASEVSYPSCSCASCAMSDADIRLSSSAHDMQT